MNKIFKVETIFFGIWFGFVFPMHGFYKETVTWKIASQSPQSLANSCIKNKNPLDIICKKSNTRSLGIGHYYLFYFWRVPPDDYLQEVESSGWSFARGRILWMIICKRPDPPNDHLQEARSSRWSFARGRILRMIICKRPNPPDDHLKVARSSGWSFARV